MSICIYASYILLDLSQDHKVHNPGLKLIQTSNIFNGCPLRLVANKVYKAQSSALFYP